MNLKLVPPAPAQRCHFRLVHQYGRGSNRRAVYACTVHKGRAEQCVPFSFGTRGFTTKGKAANAR